MTESAKKQIPLARPSFGTEEEHAVCEVLRSGWVSHGPRVVEFEDKLAKYLDCKYVRAVNSGSSAILLALKAIGVGPGDSVIVPAFTCAATALPILALGADPIFVDVEVSTFHMTWSNVADAIRPDTKAVIQVHLFGKMADAYEFSTRCRERGIVLIEDACLGLGAKQNGKAAGTLGTAGCFSFHPRKIITTGEGGAVCTDDPNIAESVEHDRNYGAVSSAWSRHQKREGALKGFERLAYNFKLTDIQAAIGTVQLDKLSDFIDERRRIAARYTEALRDVPGLQLSVQAHDEQRDVKQAFVCLWTPFPIERLLTDSSAMKRALNSLEIFKSELIAKKIAVSNAAQFLPALPVFHTKSEAITKIQDNYPVSYLVDKLSFALPIFPGMTWNDQDRVIKSVISSYRKHVGSIS